MLHVLVFREHFSSESYEKNLVSALDLPLRLCWLIPLLVDCRHCAPHAGAYQTTTGIDCIEGLDIALMLFSLALALMSAFSLGLFTY